MEVAFLSRATRGRRHWDARACLKGSDGKGRTCATASGLGTRWPPSRRGQDVCLCLGDRSRRRGSAQAGSDGKGHARA